MKGAGDRRWQQVVGVWEGGGGKLFGAVVWNGPSSSLKSTGRHGSFLNSAGVLRGKPTTGAMRRLSMAFDGLKNVSFTE